MGTKRVGLARMEALMENLKREITMGVGTSLAGARSKVEAIDNSSAVTIALTEAAYPSGTVFSCDFSTGSENVDISMPAPTAGLSYRFVAKVASGTSTVKLQAASTILQGTIVCTDGTLELAGGSRSALFANSKFEAGTILEFISDGTKWYVTGTSLCDVANITVA